MSRDVPQELPAVPAAEHRGPGRAGLLRILSGLGWNTGGQIASVALNLVLTPFLLLRLGVNQYGLYALLSSFRGLLSNLDGGFGPTSSRFFAVYAGADDRRSTAGLVLTISAILTAIVGTLAGIVALLAPQITELLHSSSSLHHEAAGLLRAFMPLLLAATLRGSFQRILRSHHRWAYINISATVSTVTYVAFAMLLVGEGHGLVGLVWASVAQELVLDIAFVVAATRYFSWRDCRLLPHDVTREIARYASRVQLAAVASSFNFEIDSLLVGLIFPVRYVAYYSIGSNFASQLVSLPLNAVSPVAVTLSRTFGRSGLRSTLLEFTELQRLWVRVVAPYALIGAVCGYFGILRWLGPQERLAGAVAVILLGGQVLNLLSQVMAELGKAVNRPGLESRYLGVGVVINVVLTIPLAFTVGMLGVPIGTAIGQLVSALYFLHIAKREIDRGLRSFLADIPVLATVTATACAAALVLPAYAVAPRGAFGLLLCGVPAAVALVIHATLVGGLKKTARIVTAGASLAAPASGEPAPRDGLD